MANTKAKSYYFTYNQCSGACECQHQTIAEAVSCADKRPDSVIRAVGSNSMTRSLSAGEIKILETICGEEER